MAVITRRSVRHHVQAGGDSTGGPRFYNFKERYADEPGDLNMCEKLEATVYKHTGVPWRGAPKLPDALPHHLFRGTSLVIRMILETAFLPGFRLNGLLPEGWIPDFRGPAKDQVSMMRRRR